MPGISGVSHAREENREATTVSVTGLSSHTTSVSACHAMHDGQAESAPAAISVSLSIGLEDGRQRFTRYSIVIS